jgi:Flp pilus assembly protein TadB
MAQAKRKRTRKHRGNAAGIVERPAHNSRPTSQTATKQRRPMSKDDQRAEQRRKRQERMSRPPTWKGAMQRAGVAALLFAVLVTVFFKEKAVNSVTLAAFMFLVYIPLSYFTDRALFNWRQKKGTAPRG